MSLSPLPSKVTTNNDKHIIKTKKVGIFSQLSYETHLPLFYKFTCSIVIMNNINTLW